MDVRRTELASQLSIDNAMDGIHTLDFEGNVVAVNRAFCDMLSYSRDELLAMNVRDWDAQWSSDELRAKIDEIRRERQLFETRHRRKDGSVIDVEVSVAAAEIERSVYLFACARDITAQMTRRFPRSH